jgi:type I restriction enzyme S subunit
MVYNKLPQGWVECEFESVIDVRDGTHDSPKYYETGYPLVTSKCLKNGNIDLSIASLISENDYHKINERSKVSVGDVLFAMIGTIGNPVLVQEEPSFAIKNVALFKRSNAVIPEFLKYYLESNNVLNVMQLQSKGSTQKFVGLGYLRKFKFLLPPLNEQKRIVEKIEEEFGKIDEGVEKLKSAQEQVKQYRQSVLKSAFDGKLYKTTEWIVSKLGDICDRALKRQDSKKETEIFKYIDISSIDNHKNIITGYVVCTGANAPSRARQIVKCGDVLFSTVRTYLKNVAFLDLNDTDLIASTGFCVIRGKENLLDGRFIFNMCLYDRFLEPLNKLQRGSSYPAVRDNDVFNQFINLPTIDEQKQIVKEIEKRFKVADETERVIAENLEKAEQLKQSILKKAFEGRLVPQYPTDQPASELLAKIQAERKK